jgi:hypothetical protein
MHLPEDGLSLLSNNADHISKDRSGNVWVGIERLRLEFILILKEKFNSFYPHVNHPEIQDFYPSSF